MSRRSLTALRAGSALRRTSTTRSMSAPRLLVATAAIGIVALVGGSLPGAGAQSGSESGSEDIDVLTATREEVNRALAELDERYAAQQAEVDRANEAADRANEAVERAEARVALADHEVELARETVAEYAVEAYMRPPARDSLRVLSISRADDAAYASSVIQILTEERHKVVDVLVEKQQDAARERSKADDAASAARSAASDAQVKLVDLDRMRAEQQRLAAALDERLDRALSEAAALAAIDRQMAEELTAQEVALRESGPASRVQATPATVPASANRPPSAAGAAAPTTTRAPSPTTTRAPAPTTTTKPSSPTPAPPTGTVTWSDVTRVGGIWVHKSIATNVSNLLNAATAAGFNLGGGGYRDSAGQIATRRANCGTSYYDIYEKPASQCVPPTAIPGRSMHERGLAIDFTSSGSLISSRSNPAFVWLSNNAHRYGLYNLPSEPWHWSTTGG